MSPLRRIIGIDPGASGACAIYHLDRHSWVVHPSKTTHPLDAVIDATCGDVTASQCVAYLEQIGGYIAGAKLPGSSMFKMGHNAGYWEGALSALGVKVILVRPQTWQKNLPGLTGKKGPDRKRALKNEAIRRFPTLRPTLQTCDALLIADHGIEAQKRN